MKKIIIGLSLAVMTISSVMGAERVKWPVWFAFNDAEDIDVIGFRFTLPSGYCEQVTGIDLGLIGRSQYFNGIQINLLRNDVKDTLSGFQIGGYNSADLGDAMGLQVGLWNESKSLYGVQAGIINVSDFCNGVQIGLINRTEDMYGFQVGLINVIRGSQVPFCPIVNVGF